MNNEKFFLSTAGLELATLGSWILKPSPLPLGHLDLTHFRHFKTKQFFPCATLKFIITRGRVFCRVFKILLSTKINPLEILFSTTTKSLLTLIFEVLFNLPILVRTRHFCIHLQAMLLRETLSVSLTKDYGHFLRKGLNTDFHPELILLRTAVLSG